MVNDGDDQRRICAPAVSACSSPHPLFREQKALILMHFSELRFSFVASISQGEVSVAEL